MERNERQCEAAAQQEIAADNRPSSLRSGGCLQLNFSRSADSGVVVCCSATAPKLARRVSVCLRISLVWLGLQGAGARWRSWLVAGNWQLDFVWFGAEL